MARWERRGRKDSRREGHAQQTGSLLMDCASWWSSRNRFRLTFLCWVTGVLVGINHNIISLDPLFLNRLPALTGCSRERPEDPAALFLHHLGGGLEPLWLLKPTASDLQAPFRAGPVVPARACTRGSGPPCPRFVCATCPLKPGG